MALRAVHWYEGMFLRPQHFQAAQHYHTQLVHRSARWDVHYNWGLRTLDLDLDALANSRFVVRALAARLRDGTLIVTPDDGSLPVLDLKNAFGRDGTVTVFLAVPVLQAGRPNVATNGTAARYLVESLELEDENTGLNPHPFQVRLLNLTLLLSTQDHAGYETLPIARVRKADRAEALPQLDESYIPPLVAADAWPPLAAGILQPVYHRLGKKLELLSSQVVSRGITFDSQGQGDRLLFEQLRVLNEVYALLDVLLFAQGVHPLPLYVELCRLVGRLAIFGAPRRPPELPKYDHDDLGTCFWRVKQHLDGLLDIVVEPDYKERPFVGAGLRMQVALEPAWLEAGWQMFVGVQSPLPAEQCVHLLTRGLDMKIGSSERVDEIFRQGQAGLRFTYSSYPPRALPVQPGLIYFQVDRESQAAEWDKVQRSLSLAVRLNENLIVGNIQGQRTLTIKVGGQTSTLQFTLYMVPPGKGG
jgi:type VI secretion system protein ImpJ